MTAPDGVLLRTERLTRSFGSLTAVNAVSLTVRKGELRSIIGPNGAGKTTFFRLVSGEMEPSSGRVLFQERDITGLPQHRVCRLGIAKSYQITNIFPHLSVLENVRVAVQGYARSFNFWSRADQIAGCRERAVEILAMVSLVRQAERPAAHLSHGEKRHLEIGIALASDPALLLLDEPTAGMNNTETDSAMELIRRVSKGKTLLMVEHDMKVVFDLADVITVLVYGQVIASGPPHAVRANAAVREAYLGAPVAA